MTSQLDDIVALDARLLAAHTQAAADRFDAAAHRETLASALDKSDLVTVTRNGRHVAHLYVWPLDDTRWFVGGFSIDPGHRTISVLAEMARSLTAIMAGKDIRVLESHVYKTNRPSLAFHTKLGFERLAENDKGVALRIDRGTLERSVLARRLARPSPIAIRPATHADAVEAANLLRRSITQLCVPDHGNDAARLSHWLANKTPEQFRDWLDDPANTMVVAIVDGRIASAGGIRQGEGIVLNYIHPDMRFRGISSAMMDHLEAMLARSGTPIAYLVATITARPFYEARGYTERLLPPEQRPLYGIPMQKPLKA